MSAENLSKFILEREAIRLKKEAGKKRPWTQDEILATYRFCNVHREDDAVSKWVAEHWRTPHAAEKHVWFAMLVARLFNNPETLAELPVPYKKFDVEKYDDILQRRKMLGEKVFNAAYIVSTNGLSMDKVDYVLEHILNPAWAVRDSIAPKVGDTLADFAVRLCTLRGISGFMAGQIIADCKYTSRFSPDETSDWWSFAISGPGSRRGLNRVLGYRVDQAWKEPVWLAELACLHAKVTKLTEKKIGRMHAQDLQNCLCEFDKYERARVGDGRPKQKYTPATEK